ncbi:hydroxyethylthiazole kinase [Thermaerobacter marianensis DSM 12885]|uniref:Hydroxyethylthiazole kinase n=1 Tax=Thermaerobacter marianensis (strain ATCC 700841 / DSM 12885 / JCM 10246 / 7p75a) TaxID=644966 RepID=E6SJ39_THEM7|nr:hydroxyethylthiazole kinase [Thermaerobacter marianensis]ADU52063.1 hydroxyethylthiazole kinase [Thermaerobacter marianensis DSM 12885]
MVEGRDTRPPDWEAAAAQTLARLRRQRPLVHHLTNYVVMQWTANITLALGASPLMASEPAEFPAIAAAAGALVLNIGSLRERDAEVFAAAQREARRRGIPVVLDPVGAGFTSLRTELSRRLLAGGVTAVRGNGGEILALADPGGGQGHTRGVDSGRVDTAELAEAARELARRHGCVVVASGPVDLVTDGRTSWWVANGHPWLAAVTGGGCGATAAVAAFLAGSSDPLRDATLAMAVYGLAAERAASRSAGPGTFQGAFLDELYALAAAGTAVPRGLRVTASPGAREGI